jgi:hypothetical protein
MSDKIFKILLIGLIFFFPMAGTALAGYFDSNTEPIRMIILGFGMIGLAYYGRKRRKNK